MQPKLLAITGALAGTVVHLPEGGLSIGRDGSNDLCLSDPLVSRTHCILRRADDTFEIIDLDSHNGTFVQEIPVRARGLRHGDSIRVGSSEFVFVLNDETAADPLEICAEDAPTRAAITPVRLDGSASLTGAQGDLAEMAQTATALIRIIEICNSVRDLDVLQRDLLQLIFEVVPAERGAIVLLDGGDGQVRSIVSSERVPTGRHAIRIRRDLIDRALWERSAIFWNPDPRTVNPETALCVPLLSVERALGAVYLTLSPQLSQFGQDHVLFLGSIARIMAVTLENRLILETLRSDNEALRQQLHTSTMIGESRKIAKVREFVDRVAPGDSTVLIRGESGTGKELVARAIHHQSPRAERPFIAINCAAIPDALLESELFGHEKGAFTGASVTKKGKIEFAEDGTLFLDEVGQLAPLLQAKLLRVLQQREFERIGGMRTLPFSARVVAATNKNLERAIRSGEFREDLYYRLNVVSTTVPPLRDRREDIPLLALFFIRKHIVKGKRPFKGISREARTLLLQYSWPGNIRELENAIEHALVLGMSEEILPEDLPDAILEQQTSGNERARYHSVLNRTKRDLIVSALREADDDYPLAAQALGLHPKYLHRLARNLGIKGHVADDVEEDA